MTGLVKGIIFTAAMGGSEAPLPEVAPPYLLSPPHCRGRLLLDPLGERRCLQASGQPDQGDAVLPCDEKRRPRVPEEGLE